MTKISKPALDNTLSGQDKLLGTDKVTGRTSNYSLEAIRNYILYGYLLENVSDILLDGKQSVVFKGQPNGYAPLDQFGKLVNEYLVIINDLTTGGATNIASAEQLKVLNEKINTINILVGSDTLELDTVQEIVDAIKTVQTSLSTILVNNLTTGGVTKALTAEQGKVLNLKATIQSNITVSLANGKTLGKYLSGQTVLSTGMTLEQFARDIAIEYVNPAFTSFEQTGNAPNLVEVGITLSGNTSFSWGITLNSGIVPSIDIYDNTAAATLLATTSNDGSQDVVITTKQLNSDGATQSWKGIGNNTNGAAFNSSNFVVTSRFFYFFGSVSNFPVDNNNGAANRTYGFDLLGNVFKANGITSFTLQTGTVNTKFIVLLPPGITITSVIDATNANTNITNDYVLGTITIKDAGGTDRLYNKYTLSTASPYSTSANHTITTN
jgi:hypothetical protein